MALIDRNPIEGPFTTDLVLKIVSDPHILKIDVIPVNPDTEWPDFNEIVPQIRKSCRIFIDTIEEIWGYDFFDEWYVNLRTPGRSEGLYVETLDPIELLDSRFRAAIFLPTALFPARPKPPGRISSAEVVEAPLARALDAAIYSIGRYLAGLHYGWGGLTKSGAKEKALLLLCKNLEAATPLFFVDSKTGDRETRKEATLKKIAEDASERGARHARNLWGAEIGAAQFEAGRRASRRILRGRLTKDPGYIEILTELQLIIDMRLAARVTHEGQRGIRTKIGTDNPPTFVEALHNLALPSEHSAKVVREKKRKPTVTEMLLMARQYDVDLTEVFGDQLFYRPLVAAWRAIGAYERDRTIPNRDSEAGLFALYGLRAVRRSRGLLGIDDENLLQIVNVISPGDHEVLGKMSSELSEQLRRIPRDGNLAVDDN
jgi:hypothetical protein